MRYRFTRHWALEFGYLSSLSKTRIREDLGATRRISITIDLIANRYDLLLSADNALAIAVVFSIAVRMSHHSVRRRHHHSLIVCTAVSNALGQLVIVNARVVAGKAFVRANTIRICHNREVPVRR